VNILELIGRDHALFGADIAAHKTCKLGGIDPIAESDSLRARASPHLQQNAIRVDLSVLESISISID